MSPHLAVNLGPRWQVATIKLTNANISAYVTHGLTESWSFTYQKIEWAWLGDGGISAQDDWEAVS